MPTHDWTGTDVIPNGSGSAVRADLNDALLALFSQNSNGSAPTTTVAYMLWADSNEGYLKIRDSASSSTWHKLFKLNGEWDPLKLVNGTAGTPSLQFSASGTDTGLYSPGADQVAITTAGVQRVNFNGATEVVFNDVSADVDFRIEGNNEPNLFKIDAGNDQVQVKNLNGGPLAGTRNLLINGALTINQRGYVSGTATTTANQYTVDRWRVVTSGQSLSFSSVFGVNVVFPPAGGVEQVIEGENVVAGTYTLSWVGTATAQIKEGAGSFSTVLNGGQVYLAGGFDVTVRFSGSGSDTFSLAQLEIGSVATPFERRNYGLELALCQRYFFRIPAGQGYESFWFTTGTSSLVMYPKQMVPLRAAPVMSPATVTTETTYHTTASGTITRSLTFATSIDSVGQVRIYAAETTSAFGLMGVTAFQSNIDLSAEL